MELITITKPKPESQAKRIADELLEGVNVEMQRRVDYRRVLHGRLWNSPVPPDDIIAAMGTNAKLFCAITGEEVEHITRVATTASKTLGDMIPAVWCAPIRELQPQPDGTVLIAEPAEGLDKWGKVIPIPPVPETPEEEAARLVEEAKQAADDKLATIANLEQQLIDIAAELAALKK